MVAHILTDTRYALRQMLKAPGFTAVAVLTLAFGVGAIQRGVQRRQCRDAAAAAYPQPDRLVRVLELVPQFGRFSVAPANFLDWRAQNTVFDRIAAFGAGYETLVGTDGSREDPRAAVSWNVFDVLGVSPALGRTFRHDEDLPSGTTSSSSATGCGSAASAAIPAFSGARYVQREPVDGRRRDARRLLLPEPQRPSSGARWH